MAGAQPTPATDPYLEQLDFEQLAQLVHGTSPDLFYRQAGAFDRAADRLREVTDRFRAQWRDLGTHSSGATIDRAVEAGDRLAAENEKVLEATSAPGYARMLRRAGDAVAEGQRRMRDLEQQRSAQAAAQPGMPGQPPAAPGQAVGAPGQPVGAPGGPPVAPGGPSGAAGPQQGPPSQALGVPAPNSPGNGSQSSSPGDKERTQQARQIVYDIAAVYSDVAKSMTAMPGKGGSTPGAADPLALRAASSGSGGWSASGSGGAEQAMSWSSGPGSGATTVSDTSGGGWQDTGQPPNAAGASESGSSPTGAPWLAVAAQSSPAVLGGRSGGSSREGTGDKSTEDSSAGGWQSAPGVLGRQLKSSGGWSSGSERSFQSGEESGSEKNSRSGESSGSAGNSGPDESSGPDEGSQSDSERPETVSRKQDSESSASEVRTLSAEPQQSAGWSMPTHATPSPAHTAAATASAAPAAPAAPAASAPAPAPPQPPANPGPAPQTVSGPDPSAAAGHGHSGAAASSTSAASAPAAGSASSSSVPRSPAPSALDLGQMTTPNPSTGAGTPPAAGTHGAP
ncbi:MAG: hypothetical protein IJH84_19440, partial [Saccharopolyspora sp.]|uniref:hypothetical protein n=1 Tax=Saccharopolyspora sp. TaxID=33915 RepID=UPI0025E82322